MALSPLARAFDKDRRLTYDGSQLRAHFLRREFGLVGDGAAIFRGPCDVRGDALVDLADRDAALFIRSEDMLHLIVERFDPDLVRCVFLQRLIAGLVAETTRDLLESPLPVVRRGDDVFVQDRKLTVSIATASATSGLIHVGVNVDDRNTPVAAAALAPLGIDPDVFAETLLERITAEIAGADEALCKVTAVGDYYLPPEA